MSPRTIYPLSLTDTAFIAIDYTTDKGTLVGYSVALVTWFEGRWRTVRVYDNAHGRHEMHRHTLSAGKQPGEEFHHGTPGEAFNDARRAVRKHHEEMIAGWLR